MTYFPSALSHEFFGTMAIAALILTVVLLWHINRAWASFTSLGQQLRYVCLLYVSTLVVAAAVEQYLQDATVQLRSYGTFGFLVLLAYTMWVTYREEIGRRRRNGIR